MKRLVKLTESDLTRIVKRIISENKILDYSELYDVLQDSELYRFLDKITKIKYQIGGFGNNSGGGLRLIIYDDEGNIEDDLSINGFNKSSTVNYLDYKIKKFYLTDSMINDLKSIQKKRADKYYNGNKNDVGELIGLIVSAILNRESVRDTPEEMIDRWFNEYDKCDYIKSLDEKNLKKIEEAYFEKFTYYYNIGFYEYDKFQEPFLRKFYNCR